MLKKKPTFNYLKPIIILLLAIFLFFIILLISNFFSLVSTSNKLATNPATKLTTKNLMTLVSALSPDKSQLTKPKLYADSPIKGDAKAPITIFEFSGFDCPYSLGVQEILNKLLADYQGKIKLVWKDLPINPNDENVMLAHQAARCAQKQNKFWQYHDLLWQNQKNLTIDNFKRIATDLKLNQLDFETCLKDPEIIKIIEKDMDEADQLMISGTPHFYINDQEVMGVNDYNEFKKIIDGELKQ